MTHPFPEVPELPPALKKQIEELVQSAEKINKELSKHGELANKYWENFNTKYKNLLEFSEKERSLFDRLTKSTTTNLYYGAPKDNVVSRSEFDSLADRVSFLEENLK